MDPNPQDKHFFSDIGSKLVGLGTRFGDDKAIQTGFLHTASPLRPAPADVHARGLSKRKPAHVARRYGDLRRANSLGVQNGILRERWLVLF